MNVGSFSQVCVGVVAVLAILVLVSAFLVRFSCGTYNAVLGGTRRRRKRDEDLVPLQSASGYDYRKVVWQQRDREPEVSGVPVPSTGQAVAIVFVSAVVSGVFNGVTTAAVGGGDDGAAAPAVERLGMALVQLAFGYVTLAWVLSAMLPTRFTRACGVAAVLYLIYFLIGFLICIAAFCVGLGVGLSTPAAG